MGLTCPPTRVRSTGAAVADDGVEFAYMKASEGRGWVDDHFAANWAGAAGAEQARNFLEVAPPSEDALPPAIDLELSGNCSERPRAHLGCALRRKLSVAADSVAIRVGARGGTRTRTSLRTMDFESIAYTKISPLGLVCPNHSGDRTKEG